MTSSNTISARTHRLYGQFQLALVISFGHKSPDKSPTEATDAEVREAIEAMEADR